MTDLFGSSLRVRRASDERRRRSLSCRWRKRHRPGQIGGVRPCGSSSTKVAGTCLLVLVFPFWLLFSGVWETLIFGTGDWFAFGIYICIYIFGFFLIAKSRFCIFTSFTSLAMQDLEAGRLSGEGGRRLAMRGMARHAGSNSLPPPFGSAFLSSASELPSSWRRQGSDFPGRQQGLFAGVKLFGFWAF